MRAQPVIRLLIAAVLLAVGACSAGCGTGGIPQSSLLLRNATTNAIVSTAGTTGTVALHTGDTLPLLVVRTFKDENGDTKTSDVTAFCVYVFGGPTGVVGIDAYGNITATAAGTTQLWVKFRADGLDPYDIVKLNIEVS
jgi:hypothetical protein